MSGISKSMFGYLLGPIFRLQKKQGICRVDDATIYGLITGVESAFEEIEAGVDPISHELVEKVQDILKPYFDDPEKPLSGYYQIEPEFNSIGVGRGTAIVILKYLNAKYQYEEVL